MAHNLVFVAALSDNRGFKLTTERDPNGRALMVYRKVDNVGVPWHGYGTEHHAWTWEAFREAMHLDRIQVASSDSYSRVLAEDGSESFVRVPGEQHLRLHLGASSVHVGTMGQNYALLSRQEFFSPLEAFIAEGFQLDTAGDLAGGSRSWFQVDTGQMLDVRKNDPVRSSALFANSYDGSLAYTSATVLTRVECANRLAMALRETKNAEANAMRAKHSGNIQGKALDITSAMAEHLRAALAQVEVFKRLDAVKVRGQLDLINYAGFLASGASDAKIAAGIDSIPKVSNRSANEIENAWMVGPGSRRESYWDLYNAATYSLTHSLGNEKQGESEGGRIARRLDSLMFGASADKLADALRIAETMASLRAV